MPQDLLSAGNPIEARCTKCRKNREHLILSMKENRPDKVQCLTCEYQHSYKPPVVLKTPAETLIKKNKEMKRRKNESERKEWNTLRPDMDSKKVQSYSMTATYRVNSLINHPIFGLGQVQRVVGSQKVEVLFEDGLKTMRCR